MLLDVLGALCCLLLGNDARDDSDRAMTIYGASSNLFVKDLIWENVGS